MNARAATKRDFERICGLLPTLTAAELEQVKLRASFLASGTPATAKKAPAAAADDDWLLRGLEDELRRRGVLSRTGRLMTDQVSGWKEKSAAVRSELERHLGTTDRRQLAAMGLVAARALVDYLVAVMVTDLRPRTVLQNVGLVLPAVDAAFPGYMEAGLLRCCLDPSRVGAA